MSTDAGIAEQLRALTEVVEEQRGQDHGEPGHPDGAAPEVAHVGVECLATGDHEHDGPENQEARQAVAAEESGSRAVGLTAARTPGSLTMPAMPEQRRCRRTRPW